MLDQRLAPTTDSALAISHWTWGPFASTARRRAVNRRYAAVDG